MTAGLPFDQLLAAAQSGAGWARARLYEWLAPAVTGYARAQGVADPADLTSDVFVAVLTGLSAFAGDERSFRSWVFTIAYRRVADDRRGRARAARALAAPATGTALAAAPSAEDVTLARLGGARVLQLLDILTPDQRQVLALRVIADLSLDEVAGVVGKPVGAVKALQHRALASLRRSISGEAVSH